MVEAAGTGRFWDRIGREAAWLVAGQALTALGGLIALRVLTGLYPRDVYGLAWLFINGAGFAVTMFTGPLGQALNRFYHDDGGQERLDGLLGLVWRFEAAAFVSVGALYYVVVFSLGSLRGEAWLSYLVMPLYFCFLSFMNIAQGLLNTSRRRGWRVALLAAEAWLKPAGALAFCLLWKPDVNSFVLGYASASVVTGTAGAYLTGGYGSRPPFRLPMPDGRRVREVLAYGIPWAGFAGGNWALQVSDRYLVNLFWGAAMTGAYVAAYQVGSALFQLLGGVFGPLVQPVIFNRAGRSEAAGAESLSLSVRAFAWISLPVLAVFVVMRGWLLRWLTAPAYWEGGEAVLLIGLGVYLWVLGDRFSQAFLVVRRSGAMMAITLAAAVVNMVINLFLVPRVGMTGAALSTLVAYAAYAAGALYFGKKAVAWKFPLGSYILAGGVAGFACVCGVSARELMFAGRFDLFSAGVVGFVYLSALALGLWLFRRSAMLDLRLLTR